MSGCYTLGRAWHPGPVVGNDPVEHLSLEFVNVGSWRTTGDLAVVSDAQFLAVAEHWLIPAGGRSIGHQLRKAGLQSVFGACLPGSSPSWACWGGCG